MPDVGLEVVEGVSNGVTPLTGASKHNIGLLMERERGVPLLVKRVTSLQEDRRYFGGIVPSQYGALVTRHIYNNAGQYGAVILGSRVVGDGSLAATGLLTNGAPGNQAMPKVVDTPAAVGVNEVVRFTPANPSTGDIFTLTSGSSSVSHTTLVGETPEDIVNDLFTKVQARIAASDADWITVVPTKAVGNAYLILTHTTPNAPIVATSQTTNGNAVTIGTVWAGQRGRKDPGDWGNNLRLRVIPKGHVENPNRKNFTGWVYFKGKRVEDSFSAPTWSGLIEQVNQLSDYIMIEPGAASALLDTITDIQDVFLSGGVYVAPTESDFYAGGDETDPEGLSVFDGEDVQIIANTEHHTLEWAQQLNTYCGNRMGPVGVVIHPYLATESIVESFANSLQVDGPSFIAAYNLWVKTSDESGNQVWIPALGVILGAGWIRVPGNNRDEIFTPPAGEESAFRDVIAIAPEKLSQDTINLYVQTYTTNVAVFRKGKGFYLYSSRTMATNPLYHSIHIRRQTSYYIETFRNNMEGGAQRLATPDWERQQYTRLYMFMKSEYDRGGLEGSIPRDEAVKIIVDKSINPRSQDRKHRNIVVEWIPTEQVESIKISLNRNDGSLIAEEIV
jgi:hypothetical protein